MNIYDVEPLTYMKPLQVDAQVAPVINDPAVPGTKIPNYFCNDRNGGVHFATTKCTLNIVQCHTCCHP